MQIHFIILQTSYSIEADPLHIDAQVICYSSHSHLVHCFMDHTSGIWSLAGFSQCLLLYYSCDDIEIMEACLSPLAVTQASDQLSKFLLVYI